LTAISVPALKAANAARWHAMHLKADRIPAFDAIARRLCGPFTHEISPGFPASTKSRYQEIEARTRVPWFIIAVIHEREAGGPPHWDKSIAQGDPLEHKSVNVPVGRGPFYGPDAFLRGALDALCDCPPFAARWTDWSIGGALTLLEEYNGLGYAARGVPSAYVWSGTDQYDHGKFIADRIWRKDVVDIQEGCAPILARMMAIDPSIKFE
jgi:lysozyme family protein